jgi:hypothetical protein
MRFRSEAVMPKNPMTKSALPLFLALPAALGLYWLMRAGLDVEPQSILNGGLIGASLLGTACSLDWAFKPED